MDKTYKINCKEYRLKEKYSSKDWGQLMIILGELEPKEDAMFGMVGQLLSSGNFEKLLNILLVGTEPINEVYDDDFKDCADAVNDFFALKKNMIPNTV